MTDAEKVKAWRLANPEKVRAMNLRRREAHRAWCLAHPDRVREHKLKSAKRHPRSPEQVAWVTHRVRARKFGANDTGVRPEQWAEILDLFGGRCAYCLAAASGRDHVEPLSLGGADDSENVVPCCTRCNSSKGNKKLLAWVGGL